MSGQLIKAVAIDGPLVGKNVPFPGEDYVTRVVQLRNGELSLVVYPGDKMGMPLGHYRYEDGKALWVEGELA